jgi:type I restriction enzyme, S subunit
MKKWHKSELSDLVVLQRGFDITKAQQQDGIVPVISSSGISSYHNEAKCKAPGVITGRKGTLGKVFYSDIDYWPHDTTLWVKDFKNNSPKYAYYFLKLLKLETYDVGASNPTLNRNHIHKVKINIPPLPIQRKIAAVLSAYDDLIENNNRRIAILEKMAEELYREWFVRLRFPGHEKIKIVKGVPEGWEVKALKDVASVIDCLHTKKPDCLDSGEGWLLQLENIKEHGRFSASFKYLISRADYEEWTKNIEVVEGDCLITNVGRIAAIAQIPRGMKAALGRNMTAVRPRDIPPSFLIQYLLSPHMQEEVLKKQDFGAIMGALNVRAINKLTIIVPNKDLLTKFELIVGKIRFNLWNLVLQDELLTTARDRLLTRLMSGKIDVEDLDIQFPASMKEEEVVAHV